ncbi:MAG: TRAP transporter substrate-binding protein [Geminicoccaceae bacterium]
MIRRTFLASTAAAGLGAATTRRAAAQEVTLRLHQLLSLQAIIPGKALVPWAHKVETESGGRIKVEHYPSMQLGGAPPSLYDQARDGVVDLVWTVLGYNPGRFPGAEVFELPFMVTSAEATSKAFHAFYERHLQDEFADIKPIALHVHGPGTLHMKGPPVARLEDLRGRKVRGPTRIITTLLERLGAVPVGMPVPAVPEALSKGVIDGTVIPWEVTIPLGILDLVDSHTQVSGDHGLYTATLGFVMNRGAYEGLPDDLRAVIDANSGVETAGLFGRALDRGDAAAEQAARETGKPVITIDEAETRRWKDASLPVIDDWIAEMSGRGIDGKAHLDAARTLIDQYTAS